VQFGIAIVMMPWRQAAGMMLTLCNCGCECGHGLLNMPAYKHRLDVGRISNHRTLQCLVWCSRWAIMHTGFVLHILADAVRRSLPWVSLSCTLICGFFDWSNESRRCSPYCHAQLESDGELDISTA